MTKHNANNERIKHRYFGFLKEAKRQSEPTVDGAAKALDRFEEYTGWRDFKAFHFQQAIGFKKKLVEQKGQKSGKELRGDSTCHADSTQAVLRMACIATRVQITAPVLRRRIFQ